MGSNGLNNRALETLCNEIIKAVEVKAKSVCTQMIKKNQKTYSPLGGYPIGTYCIMVETQDPRLVFGGEWQLVDGKIVLINDDNTTTVAGKLWVRIG